ncbi:hypothetical protein ACW9I6_09955 [Pseudomonas sp. SDO5522_S412]
MEALTTNLSDNCDKKLHGFIYESPGQVTAKNQIYRSALSMVESRERADMSDLTNFHVSWSAAMTVAEEAARYKRERLI